MYLLLISLSLILSSIRYFGWKIAFFLYTLQFPFLTLSISAACCLGVGVDDAGDVIFRKH